MHQSTNKTQYRNRAPERASGLQKSAVIHLKMHFVLLEQINSYVFILLKYHMKDRWTLYCKKFIEVSKITYSFSVCMVRKCLTDFHFVRLLIQMFCIHWGKYGDVGRF